MNEYTINCTPEQTKKAFALGAPIIRAPRGFYEDVSFYSAKNGERVDLIIPTAEQIINWLEEKGLVLHVYPVCRGNDYCIGYKFSCEEIERNMYSDIFSTRKEATLAAIDKALEYLENQMY